MEGAGRHDQSRAEFDAREGGAFRISLTYDAQTGTGKTTAHTDTYRGNFVKLVANTQVVEALEFETTDDALRGKMTITTTLVDANGGTDVLVQYEGLPRGYRLPKHAHGTRETRRARRGEMTLQSVPRFIPAP